MIYRTVSEWGHISYGEGVSELPGWIADELLEVAKKSDIASDDGRNILVLERSSMTAGQVVGLVASRNCTLEILPKIDSPTATPDGDEGRLARNRLVQMLAVCHDFDVGIGEIASVSTQHDHLLEILVQIFADRLSQALHRGMPRKYAEQIDDLRMLRGKLDVQRQFRNNAINASRISCRFDELTVDIPLNRVMRGVVEMLLRVSKSTKNQRKLREISFSYSDVSLSRNLGAELDGIQLDRTNRIWHTLLELARLFLNRKFQTTSAGEFKGFSLLFEMNDLFESYIAIELSRGLRGTGLRVIPQGGMRYCLNEVQSGKFYFRTRPDILVMRGNDVAVIIDTKWKRLKNNWDDPKHGISQADIYQMMAYGQLYNCNRLILLYPHHFELERPEGISSLNRVLGTNMEISVSTIDVTEHSFIEDRLKYLIVDKEILYAV